MIDSGTLTSIKKYVASIILLTAPGLILQDIIFQKGLYSGGINSMIDLVLYLINSFALSIPLLAPAFIAGLPMTSSLLDSQGREKEQTEDSSHDDEENLATATLPFALAIVVGIIFVNGLLKHIEAFETSIWTSSHPNAFRFTLAYLGGIFIAMPVSLGGAYLFMRLAEAVRFYRQRR